MHVEPSNFCLTGAESTVRCYGQKVPIGELESELSGAMTLHGLEALYISSWT